MTKPEVQVSIAGGARQEGIPIGNTFDKYGSANPIVRTMLRGFDRALTTLVNRSGAHKAHEVGCGEGYWTIELSRRGLEVRGSDFSTEVIAMARQNACSAGIPVPFRACSIYNLEPTEDRENLVICCEVLEHLEHPARAIEVLSNIASPYLIASVPREPIWRTLNMARGKYLTSLGNTPGHLQHWSRSSFVRLISSRFEVLEIRCPLPWTMVLAKVR